MKKILTIKNIYFFTAFCIFIYLILRACLVPPVHDEGATFLHYIQRNEWMPYKAHWDANNHFLNSFLSAIFFKLFGVGLFPLRLASLFFFPLYVFYTYKISEFLNSTIGKIGFLCALLGVHNLMEYFAYSRGYAMSMALIIAAIYYILLYFQKFELKKLLPFYFFSFLALFANLTLLNTILILNGILFLSFFLKNKKWILKIGYSLLGILTIVLATIIAIEMKKQGLLYYGNATSFYDLTVWSLVILIYGEYQLFIAVFYTVIAAIGVVFLGGGKNNEGIKNVFFTPRWLFAFLFLGNILATVLLQKIMQVNYPEDRTAMYFYFFLVLFFCFTLDYLPLKKIKYVAFIWVVLPFHFIFSINTTHSSYWYYEHLPVSFYNEIEKRVSSNPAQASIGGYKLMELVWAYYNHQLQGGLNDMQTKDYPSFYYDYLLLYDDNNLAFAKQYYTIIAKSPFSNIHLLERKEKIKFHLITTYSLPNKVNNSDEFINFYEHDSLKKYTNLCFDFSTHFKNEDDFFLGMFTLATNINGKEVTHENQEMHFMRTEWRKGYNFHHRLYVQNISTKTDRIVLYFWNKRKRKVNLTNNIVKIYYWENK